MTTKWNENHYCFLEDEHKRCRHARCENTWKICRELKAMCDRVMEQDRELLRRLGKE